ncbi:MAG: LamG domain-containing protein [Planctomycetia bacterium]|jgi:hypothetical protein
MLALLLLCCALLTIAATSAFYITDDAGTQIPFGTSGTLRFPNISGTPNDITVIFDHTVLDNIGTYSHSQLDSHVDDATIHFTEGSIDHTAIQNIGAYTHSQIDSHLDDGTIHYPISSIDHTAIQHIGAYSHSQLDSHVDDSTIHYPISSIHHDDLTGASGYSSHSTIDAHLTTASGYFSAIDAHTADTSIHVPIYDNTSSLYADRVWSSLFTNTQIDDKISAAVFSSGAADMQKATYDTDDNGVVDAVDGTLADMFKSTYDTDDNGVVDAVDNAAPALSVSDDTTTVNAVDFLRFNPASGFSVTDDGNGDVSVSLGSSWNPIQVAGQATLDATGEETLEIVAGDNITLFTNITGTPNTLTIAADGGPGDTLTLPEHTEQPSVQQGYGTLYTHNTGEGSPIDSNTVLMLHAPEIEGQKTFTDASLYEHAIGLATSNGTIFATTALSKFGTSSIRFTGQSSDRLSSPTDSDWSFGTGDFTIDLWYYSLSSTEGGLVSAGWDVSATPPLWGIIGNAAQLWFYYDSGSGLTALGKSGAIPTSQWVHLALIRDGNTLTWYENGVSTNSHDVTGVSFDGGSSTPLIIGMGSMSGWNVWNGYIEEVRISKGVARWTANFTPPTSRYLQNGRSELIFVDAIGSTIPITEHVFDTSQHITEHVLTLSQRSQPDPETNAARIFWNASSLQVVLPDGSLKTIVVQ